MRKFWALYRNAIKDTITVTIIGIGTAVTVGAIIYAAIFLGGIIAAPFVMWAWNGSIAIIFAELVPTITLGQAFWLSILSGMLLKSSVSQNVNKSK